MARHLAAAGCRVGGCADRLQQHLGRRNAERERERAVAVVGEEPVVPRAQVAREPEQQRLVARARDLEERAVLLAQRDLTVVAEPRHEREREVGERVLEVRVEGPVDCGVVHWARVYGLRWAAVTEPVILPWRRRAARETAGFLSPAVRNLAREHGVDAATLTGRGTGGRVTRADVAEHSGTGADAPAHQVVPFNNIRKRTAVGLVGSKRTAAHALAVVAADYTAIEAARRAERLTSLPFVARAVVDALREYPMMNATAGDDGASVATHRAVHLGIAVDLDFEGLVVPVVHDADGLRLRALAAAIRDLAARARARKLQPDDLAGGTFTITNPGASGTWISFPVVNHPQVGILATDGVSKQVIADDAGRLGIAPIGHLCCAFDHRALDGAYAGAFLARVREIVETRDWSREL